MFSFLFLPVLDSLRCIVLRIIKGKNPFLGDKNHFQHILIRNYSYQMSILILFVLISLPIAAYFLNISSIGSVVSMTVIYSYFLYFGK